MHAEVTDGVGEKESLFRGALGGTGEEFLVVVEEVCGRGEEKQKQCENDGKGIITILGVQESGDDECLQEEGKRRAVFAYCSIKC